MVEQRDGSQEVFKMTPIVYILLERDGKVLLSRRSNRSKLAGRWGLPAGHLEDGEKTPDTAVREAKEELGIDIDPLDLSFVHTLNLKDGDGQRVGFILRAKKWRGRPKNQEPEKCNGLLWASPKKLPKKTGPHIVLALSNIRRGVRVTEYGWPQNPSQSSSSSK